MWTNSKALRCTITNLLAGQNKFRLFVVPSTATCRLSVRQNKHFVGGNNFHCNSLMQMKSSPLAKDTLLTPSTYPACMRPLQNSTYSGSFASTDRPFQSRVHRVHSGRGQGRRFCSEIETESQCDFLSTVRSGPPLFQRLPLSLQAKLIYGLGQRRDVLALRTERRPESRARAASEVAASAKTTPRAVPSVDWKVIAQTVSSHQPS